MGRGENRFLARAGRVRVWLRRWTENSGITGTTFIVSFVFAGLFAYHISPLFNPAPRPEKDLSGNWEVCLPSEPDPSRCNWNTVRVPADIPRSLLTDLHGWAIYRVRFTAPESCTQPAAACSFFFSEIGDSAEARLNGHTIGRHGQFPPHALYAKHYPVSFQVSRDSLRTGELANELMLVVYSLKKIQAGVRAPPAGLYTVENAFHLSQTFTTLNVVIPILCFVGLFMMAALSFAAASPEQVQDPKFIAFVRYGFASSCFLLSISEVPREYLPIELAGYFHFSLRILHDWTFFEMVGSYFDFDRKLIRRIRPLYLVTLLAFFVQFVAFFTGWIGHGTYVGRGFDVGFFTLRVAFPLLALPHLMGLYGGIRRSSFPDGRASIALFIFTFLFQVRDSAIFHGYASGIYYVKWYPFIIGLVFGSFFLERAREARAKARVEQAEARQMKTIHQATVGVAHDLEEPLKGLEMACKELERNPGNQDLVKAIAEVFPTKVQRIYELNKAILRYSKELSTQLSLEKKKTLLFGFVQSVADEFRDQPLLKEIEIIVEAKDRGISASIDQAQMRRVFRNLIRNAAEACAETKKAKITITIRHRSKEVEITVTDNGPGIAEKIRDRLFQPFESYGKENGTGLGLAMSRRLAEAHGGMLILAESNVGACFRLNLPQG